MIGRQLCWSANQPEKTNRYVGCYTAGAGRRYVGLSTSWHRYAGKLASHTARVGKQVFGSVNQPGQVGRYVGQSISWGK